MEWCTITEHWDSTHIPVRWNSYQNDTLQETNPSGITAIKLLLLLLVALDAEKLRMSPITKRNSLWA